jgi:hypothetical protein
MIYKYEMHIRKFLKEHIFWKSEVEMWSNLKKK